MRYRAALLSLALSSTAMTAANAQQTIAADRPGLATGSAVIGAGIVQLETGLARADVAGDELYSIGQLLARIGFSALELRLFGNSFVLQRGGPGTPEDEGFEDVALGVKVPLVRGPEAGYALSFDALVSAPTGSTGFARDDWGGALTLLLDIPWGRSGNLTANAGLASGPAGIQEAWTLNVTPALSFGGSWGAYVGWTSILASSDDAHFVDTGITYLPSKDLQLDVNGGWEVESDDWFVGFGLATRWGAR